MLIFIKKLVYRNAFLYRFYCFVLSFKRVENVAGEFQNIVKIVSELGYRVFPMFGTLLSIYRDGGVYHADDFDFAVIDFPKCNVESLIFKFEQNSAMLESFSTVGNAPKLVELSFRYRKAKLDIFFMDDVDGVTTHLCPDFRLSKPDLVYDSGLTKYEYNRFFSVGYPHIELEQRGYILFPIDPVRIFEIHYGSDWHIPKSNNFIDYKNYTFLEQKSSVVVGERDKLLIEMKKMKLI